MKILFIINMQDLGFEEPLGVLYLASILKKNGHRPYAAEDDLTSIKKKIRTVRPDLIALSVLTPSFPYMYETVRRLKADFDIPAVFGGPHITFFTEAVKNDCIDYGIIGEGEEAFIKFLETFERNESLDKVNNLVFKKNGELMQNPLRPLIKNLDTLPFPDRELFAGYKQFYSSDVRSVIVSRGCPYDCSYCFNKQYNELYKGLGDRMRLRSVDNVIEECTELKTRYKAKLIHFFDDIFPSQRDWLGEFADKYKEKVNLPFFTNTTFNICTEDYIRNLSRAGCRTLLIGVETGGEDLREKILNRRISNKLMIERAEMIHDYGIKIYTQNMVGLPFGSFEDDLETVKLNIEMKADFAGAYLCQPYPKTDIEKMAKAAGLLDDDYEIRRSFYYSSPLKLPDKKRIEKLRMAFAAIVNFPFLYRYSSSFVKIPTFFLKAISRTLHGYKIKTVVLRYRMSLRVFFRNLKIFFSRKINK